MLIFNINCAENTFFVENVKYNDNSKFTSCDPPTKPTHIVGNSNLCIGNEGLFYVHGAEIGYSYVWSYTGDGQINQSGSEISLIANSGGVLSVKVVNECGESDTVALEIFIHEKPDLSMIYGYPMGEVCDGTSVQIFSYATQCGACTYFWNNNQYGNAINVTATESFNYEVTVMNSFGCFDTASYYLLVHPNPIVEISASNNPLIRGSETYISVSGAETYQWNNNLSSSSLQLVSPDLTTEYMVTGTDEYGCTSTASLLLVVEMPSGSTEANILSFSFPEQVGSSIIDEASATVIVKVSEIEDVSNIIPNITVSDGAWIDPPGEDAQNFNEEIIYTVYAENEFDYKDWTIIVQRVMNDKANLYNFSFAEQSEQAIIDSLTHTINIKVSPLANLSSLVPTLTMSYGAYSNPYSGVAQDFTLPKNYTVISQDGQNLIDWTVYVKQSTFQASENASTSVRLTWKPVSGATNYRVLIYKTGTTAYVTNSTSTNTLVFSNLTPNTNYSIRLKYYKNSVWSDYSITEMFTTTNQEITFSNITGISVKASWLEYPGAISYKIRYWQEGQDMATTNKTVTSTSTSAIIGSLTDGKTYNYQVRADFGNGYTGYSTTYSCYNPSRAINFSENAGTSVKAKWYNFEGMTSARLRCWKYGTDVSTAKTVTSTADTAMIYYLEQNTLYNFQIRFDFGSGYSVYGPIYTLLTANPTFTYQNVTSNSMQVFWSGYEDATSYRLSYQEVGTTVIKTITTTSTNTYVKTLKPNTAYEFKVRPNFGAGFTATNSYISTQSTLDTTVKAIHTTVDERYSALASDNINTLIYPNPFKDNFNVLINSKHEGIINWRLTDIIGRVMSEGSLLLVEGENLFNVSTQDFNSGLYFITIFTKEKQLSYRIIKQ